MTQDDWAVRFVRVIAGQIRRHRSKRDMSARELSDACASAGYPIARSVLANLESGRRETITVPELFTLAYVLQVPPTELVLPLGHADRVEILPGVEVPTTAALSWVDSKEPLPGQEWPGTVTRMFHVHGNLVEQFQKSREAARRARQDGDEVNAAQHDGSAESALTTLRFYRKLIRSEGMIPPELPPELARVEEVYGK